MTARSLLALAIILAALPPTSAQAEPRKPTAKEVSAIGNCAAKYQDDLDEVERECLFKLVATPCTDKPEAQSTADTVSCYYIETSIWDDLLNENFKKLLALLDEQQTAKLRAMQRAWIVYRDTTCEFYWDKIQGTMAGPMRAACVTRETARRAVLLQFFSRL